MKISIAKLKAANLPHATPEIFGATIKDDAPDRAEAEKHLATLADYLKQFVPPSDCIRCGSQLGAANIVDAMIGKASFKWGLAHGEGVCSQCGYPGRAMHYIGTPEIFSVRNFILQYHPSQLKGPK